MCSLGYYRSGFVATHAFGHMMYGYTLLVPMNQRVLNKHSKGCDTRGHKWFTTHRVLKFHRSKMGIIYVKSWKECAFLVVTTVALWHSCIWVHDAGSCNTCITWYLPCFACWALFGSLVPGMCNCKSYTLVHELPQSHCVYNWLLSINQSLYTIAYSLGITNIHRIGKSGVLVGLIWEKYLLHGSKLLLCIYFYFYLQFCYFYFFWYIYIFIN